MKSEKDEFKNAIGKLKDSKPLLSVGIPTPLFFFTSATLEAVKVSIPEHSFTPWEWPRKATESTVVDETKRIQHLTRNYNNFLTAQFSE